MHACRLRMVVVQSCLMAVEGLGWSVRVRVKVRFSVILSAVLVY